MHIRSVGIVGYGAFGALLHTLVQRFAPEIQVRIHSSRREIDGEIFYDITDVAQCDALILAVPISAFEEALVRVLPFMRKDTVLVDVATVKAHTTEVLKRLAGSHQYIATHPMWGPESYEKKQSDVTGFRIVVTESTLAPEDTTALILFLRQCGFNVVEMTPDEHDKHLAESLFLTHFIGQIVARSGFTRGEIDTVSFGYLMDAVESVRHDERLFRDVFKFNPYCKSVMNTFGENENMVRSLLERYE